MRTFLRSAQIIALGLTTSLSAQATIGEWLHHTPNINTRALAYHDSLLYVATAGGVLVYDREDKLVGMIGLSEGLSYPDIQSIHIEGNTLWLGGAMPRGLVQIVDLVTGEVSMIDPGRAAITRFAAGANRMYAVFNDGTESGLIEFRKDQGQYIFAADTYKNFPVHVPAIHDVDVYGDSIFVSIDQGILTNNIKTANLKDRGTWHLMTRPGAGLVRQFYKDSTGMYALTPDTLWRDVGTGWTVFYTFNAWIQQDLLRLTTGELALAVSSVIIWIDPEDGRIRAQRFPHQILDFVEAPDREGGYATLSKGGIGYLNTSTRQTRLIRPNSMMGGYSAAIITSDGGLVAAGSGGLARYYGGQWHNLIPGYYKLTSEGVVKLHGDPVPGDEFIADTLYFRGKPSWNLVETDDGKVMAGFKGNPAGAGGLLEVSFDDVAAFAIYDTSDGVLDGLESEGYTTVRHLAKDRQGRIWVANPFGGTTNKPLAVREPVNSWQSFSLAESGNALNLAPTEIAFDSQGRVWIASEVNGHWNSSGGIAVLDHGGNPQDRDHHSWQKLSVRQESDQSNTVWSLAFDKNGVLWTLAPWGIMGFYVGDDLSLIPYLNYGPLLFDIPFPEGSKIRVDAQNNKWITSPQDGVWVLLDNTTFWPDIEGFNADNSALPSSSVLDIYLDDKTGRAVITTDKGISILKIPFGDAVANYAGMKIFPSPFRIPSEKPLVVDGIRQGSSVKIFTVEGRLVQELTVIGGGVFGYQAHWDGRNRFGEWVGSGVYLITAYLPDGGQGVGKVAVIRR